MRSDLQIVNTSLHSLVVERCFTNKFALPITDISCCCSVHLYKEIVCSIWHVCVCVGPFKICPPLWKPRSPQLPGGGWQSGLHEVDGWSHSRANLCMDCSRTGKLSHACRQLKASDRTVQKALYWTKVQYVTFMLFCGSDLFIVNSTIYSGDFISVL